MLITAEASSFQMVMKNDLTSWIQNILLTHFGFKRIFGGFTCYLL